MAVDKICAVHKSLADGFQLGYIEIIDELIAGCVHLSTYIEGQVKLSGELDDVVELLNF